MAEKRKAILVDVDKCTGCRSCLTACQNWNKTPAEGGWAELTSEDWMSFQIDKEDMTDASFLKDQPMEIWYKWQCMHCEDPACLRACPARAIVKYENGPVVIDPEKCEGVRLCVEACPYHIPKFDESDHKAKKCTMCYDRINQDPPLEPACVQACPSGALEFGDRDDLLDKANQNKGYVYGENTGLGGSSILYAAAFPLNNKILLDVEDTQRQGAAHYIDEFSHPLGMVAIVAGLGLGAAYWYKSRLDENAAREAIKKRPSKAPKSKRKEAKK